MKGLDLSRAYYEECLPLMLRQMPEVMDAAAVGLVGEGSECFGCDDEYSRDHDFGPAFCLWLPAEKLAEQRELIEAVLGQLPSEFMGLPSRMQGGRAISGAGGMDRVGAIAIEDFYAHFTGLRKIPENWRQWLAIPEYQLAACTNGAVFMDNSGLFGRWRQVLLSGYPRDVKLKKLACRCMQMAQSGQYNLPRSLKRGDLVAAMLAQAHFAEAALSFVYLANDLFMPYYKLAARLASGLPLLGNELCEMLDVLARSAHGDHQQAMKAVDAVNSFCDAVASWLRQSGLSDQDDNWLWAHGPQIIDHVSEIAIRRMDLLADILPYQETVVRSGGESIAALQKIAYAALEDGDYDKSINCFGRALELARQIHGAGSVAVADAAQRLSIPCYRKGEYAAALDLLEQARTIWEKQPDTPLPLGVCYNNLGRIYEETDQTEMGIAMHRKACSLRRKLLGEHEDTAFSHGNLGVALAKAGQWQEAEHELAAAVAIYANLGQGEGELAISYARNLEICRQALADCAS